MSCLQGPVHRAESTHDDDLWTRYHEGQLTQAQQSERVRPISHFAVSVADTRP